MKPTVKDVAALAGVSPATVSRVLTQKNNVNSETKTLVHEAMDKLNYQYQKAAAKSTQRCEKTVLVITGELGSSYFALWHKVAWPIITSAGYTMLTAHADYNPEIEENYLEYAQKNRLAGAFMITPMETPHLRNLLKNKDIPVVLVNRPLRAADQDVVCQDHFRSGYQAVCHLVQHGHKRIICVFGCEASASDIEKLSGAREAMRDAGLSPDSLLVRYVNYNRQSAYELFMGELKDLRGYTAVFTGSELMTRGIGAAQDALGRKIPEDLSVICSSCTAFTMRNVVVSAVQQNAEQMGRCSAERLLEAMEAEAGQAPTPQKFVFPPVLCPGESVHTLKNP